MTKTLFQILIFCIFTFSSCLSMGFSDFYEPWFEDNYFPAESYLKEDETPEIIKTPDLDIKFREISSNWYYCIGYSGFNDGENEDEYVVEELTNLCKAKKAKLAIWSKEYTDTRRGTYSLPHTNYHWYTNSFGYTSSYTTTSYSTHSYSEERFDFSSYLFVSIPDKFKIFYTPGFSIADLSETDRETYKQNTGCLINIVYKNTTAYYANLVHGDIITEINGTKIYSVEDFQTFRKDSNSGDMWKITIVRNGNEKEVNCLYSLYPTN